MAQRAEYQIQVAEVLGSMLTGVTFCCWIFCFHISEASDANIGHYCQFCVFVKNTTNRTG